jgi:hypothetical protein
VRRLPLDVEQPAVGVTRFAQTPDQTDEAAFEASVRSWYIDSAAKRPPMDTP